MVERRPDKTEVEGSIPSMPTNFNLSPPNLFGVYICFNIR